MTTGILDYHTFDSFQCATEHWADKCFGNGGRSDLYTRHVRFYEEATELIQAGNISREHAHMLVDYVYGRPTGEVMQEIGGVMITVSLLASAHEHHLREAANRELTRCWDKMDAIREKQKMKPLGREGGPLPGGVDDPTPHTPPTPGLPAGAYAIVELMGHQQMVGRVAEGRQFGVDGIVVEPIHAGQMLPPVFRSGAALYGVTPCTPERAWEIGQRTYGLPDGVRHAMPKPALPAPAPVDAEFDEVEAAPADIVLPGDFEAAGIPSWDAIGADDEVRLLHPWETEGGTLPAGMIGRVVALEGYHLLMGQYLLHVSFPSGDEHGVPSHALERVVPRAEAPAPGDDAQPSAKSEPETIPHPWPEGTRVELTRGYQHGLAFTVAVGSIGTITEAPASASGNYPVTFDQHPTHTLWIARDWLVRYFDF